MITTIENLPKPLIGFTFSGKVTGKDYETTLCPVIKEAAKQKKKIRIICEFGKKFKGLDLKAMIDDARIGIRYYLKWEKVAIVSDHDTINHIIKAFGFLMPGRIRIFPLSGRMTAIDWVSETGPAKKNRKA
jgi:hypothetical protein